MSAQPGDESGSEDGELVQKRRRKRPKVRAKLMQTAKRAREDSDTAVTLFQAVIQGKMAMTAIVDDWIEAYKADRKKALSDLMQFFFSATGCKGKFTADMLRDASKGFENVIKNVIEDFGQAGTDYPIIKSGYNFRNFGSNFSDFVQQKKVRLKFLQILQGLYTYKDEEMKKDLIPLTERLKARIASMTFDTESDVSVLAINVLILILKSYGSSVLSWKDSKRVCRHVYSVHRPVAIAAAEILNTQLFTNKDITPGHWKSGKRRSANASLVKDLVCFFIKDQFPKHADDLVDSLWDFAPEMLKDWDCMTDLLLEEPANDRDQLDTRQESALVDIMVCSVRQAAEGTPAEGRLGYPEKLADRSKVVNDRKQLTGHFINNLLLLLQKYHHDKEKTTIITMLLKIPTFFDLELYNMHEGSLETLLKYMETIFRVHTDSVLLNQAAMTYHVICDNKYSIATKAQGFRKIVIDTWVEVFTRNLPLFKAATSDGSNGADAEIYCDTIVQALIKLNHIHFHYYISSHELRRTVFSILQLYQEKPDSVPKDMLYEALRFLGCNLSRALQDLKERENPEHSTVGPPDQSQEIDQLRECVTKFMQICEELLSNSPHPKVKEASYLAVCDVMFLTRSGNLQLLVQAPSDYLQGLLIDFINTYVFVKDEDDDEEEDAKIATQDHRTQLLKYICRLFIFNVIELRLVAEVFRKYIRFYPEYGDMIEETLSEYQHANTNTNKMEWARALVLSLMHLYSETVRHQGGSLDHSSQEYGHMKELARRMSLTLGPGRETRDAVVALHKKGILFALKRSDDYHGDCIPPENLSFLRILVEFCSNLMENDRETVMNCLDEHIKPHMLKQRTAGWIPLVTYRNSLMQDESDPDEGI